MNTDSVEGQDEAEGFMLTDEELDRAEDLINTSVRLLVTDGSLSTEAERAIRERVIRTMNWLSASGISVAMERLAAIRDGRYQPTLGGDGFQAVTELEILEDSVSEAERSESESEFEEDYLSSEEDSSVTTRLARSEDKEQNSDASPPDKDCSSGASSSEDERDSSNASMAKE